MHNGVVRTASNSYAKRPLLSVVSFLVLVAFLIVTSQVRGQAPGGAQQPVDVPPTARVIGPTHDFGKIVEGRKLSHTFKIMNVGNTTLEIIKVAPDCSCTSVGTYPPKIEPGATGDFTFELNTAKLLGPFTKHINVMTNDPITPTVGLSLIGEGRRMVEVMPISAGFGRISDSDVHEMVLTLTNRSEEPLQASIVGPSQVGRFDFELVETITGIEYKLFVMLRPPYQEGTLNNLITIGTNFENQKTITISAVAIILPRLEVQPSALFIGDAQGSAMGAGKPVTKAIEFINRDSKPVHVVSVNSNDPAIKVTSKEAEPGRVYRIFAVLPPDYRPPPEGRSITITTNVAEKAEFVIPIRQAGAPKTPGSALPAPDPTEKAKKPVMELVGKPAPELRLTSATGHPINNEEFKHYPATILNFVAPDCPFCKRQIPNVEKVRAEYEERGVRFVLVSETLHGKAFEQPEAQVAFDAMGAHFEMAMDPGNAVGQKYKVTSFPVMVLVGKDGKVIDAFPGARTDNIDQLRGQIDKLLGAEAGTRPEKK